MLCLFCPPPYFFFSSDQVTARTHWWMYPCLLFEVMMLLILPPVNIHSIFYLSFNCPFLINDNLYVPKCYWKSVCLLHHAFFGVRNIKWLYHSNCASFLLSYVGLSCCFLFSSLYVFSILKPFFVTVLKPFCCCCMMVLVLRYKLNIIFQ